MALTDLGATDHAIARARRVVVIGGGIFGTSTAEQLVRRGLAVTLITDAGLASGASGRSLGWLNAFGDQPEEYLALRLAAMERYRRLAAELPGADYVRFSGGVWWGADESETESEFARLADRGYPVRRIARDDVSRLLPGLSTDRLPRSVLYEPDEGWVELAALVPELGRRFTAAGGVLITDAGPATLTVHDGRVTEVVTRRQTVPADLVVIAAGAATPAMLAAVMPLPDSTPVALLVRTKPIASRLQVVVNSPRVAIRPGLGGGLAVDHDWASRHVTVGSDGSLAAPPDVVHELLDEASALLEGHPRLEADVVGIGPKPVPGDGLPVIGAVDAVEGCYVAFSHSGATLGLITGELLSAEIVDGTPSPLLAPFRPDRFTTRRFTTVGGA